MSWIPEIRVLSVLTEAGYYSFQSDIGGGWITATVGPAAPGSYSWTDVLMLNRGSPAGAPNDCEEAIENSHGAAFTFAYNSSGALRGKFTWAKNAGTFKIRPNGDGLLTMMGFTSPPAGLAASIDANIPCSYIYTAMNPIKADDRWNSEVLGSDHEVQECEAIETTGPSGITQAITSLVTSKVRPIRLTCVPSSDLPWLVRLWNLLRTGRPFRFYQDRTNTSAFDVDSNPGGYVDMQLTGESLRKFSSQKTYPGTEGWLDIVFDARVYVAPP